MKDRESRAPGVILGVADREPIATTFGSPPDRRRDLALGVVNAGGWLLLVVAWTHLGLIWFPTSFGAPQWEYATSTQSVDIFPLGIMGMTLVAAVALFRDRRRTAIALGAWCLLSALVLLAVATLVALNLPIAWRSLPEQVRSGVIKTGAKAFLFALLFSAYHAWLGVRLLRSRRVR